jgi:hypothetical protein
MGKEEKPSKKNEKKEFIASVHSKLEMAFSDLKSGADEKKFEEALKKSSKILGTLLFVKKKKEKKEKKEDNKVPVITTKNTGQ